MANQSLFRSFSDTDLLLSNDLQSNINNNLWLSYSWPLLMDSENPIDQIPPDYDQLCNYEREIPKPNRFRWVNNRYTRSTSLKDDLRNKDKNLFEMLESIRKENLILTNNVLKINEDIKDLKEKYQKLNISINESQSENRKTEKKTCAIEERLNLSIKEAQLSHESMEQLKKNLNKLKNQVRETISMQYNKEKVNSNNTDLSDSQLSSSYASSSATYSNQSSNMSSSGTNNSEIQKVNQRLEQLEIKLMQMTRQNLDIHEQMERFMNSWAVDENVNKKVEQKLQYMNDLNQLLQLKINMLESKLEQFVLSKTNNDFNKINPSAMATASINATNIDNSALDNMPSTSNVAPNIAYVVPNVRNQQISYLHPTNNPNAIVINNSPSSNSTNANISTTSMQQSSANQILEPSNGCFSHRRCRRNHRIKLFPHRRSKH